MQHLSLLSFGANMQGVAALISVAWLQAAATLCWHLLWLEAQMGDALDSAAAAAAATGRMLLQRFNDAGMQG
jgi:hypothetical protein